RRPPGREAYPGVVFSLHSRILERAAKLRDDHAEDRLTALPILETQSNVLSAYIPPNVKSIIDAHNYLVPAPSYPVIRPANNVGRSVSRVGGDAQVKAMRQVAGRLRLDLSQYRELAAFAQFGSDLDRATQAQLARGERMTEILKQEQYAPMPVEEQVAIIFAGVNGLLDDLATELIRPFEKAFLEHLRTEKPEILQEIREKKVLDASLEERLKDAVLRFKERFRSSQP